MRHLMMTSLFLLAACDSSTPTATVVQPTQPLPPPTTLAMQKNCIACHNATGNMVGPSWHAIADKYKNDAGAADRLTAKVLNGGTGSFGAVVMPPQSSKLTTDEARYMVDWLLKGAIN